MVVLDTDVLDDTLVFLAVAVLVGPGPPIQSHCH